MTLCIIPARGGSKRIPRKNIKPFCGKPMLHWPVTAAQDANVFDRIILSTDDAEFANLGRDLGLDVPFERPAELADDHATTVDVIAHAIRTLDVPDDTAVCCLYATAPFVQSRDLVEGLQALPSNDFVIPVTSYAFPIQRSFRRDGDGTVSMFNPEEYQTRSQDLEEAYHDAGMFYWATAGQWASGKSPFDGKVGSLILPRVRVQDIDTPEDWDQAEAMFRALGLDRS